MVDDVGAGSWFFRLAPEAAGVKYSFQTQGLYFPFGNRCAVHAGRPWTCRFHPYTVSFSAGEGRFPVGEMALPSCPGYAAAFGIAVGEEYIQKLVIIRRDEQNPRLVLLKLKNTNLSG